jgi:hypothetical protein
MWNQMIMSSTESWMDYLSWLAGDQAMYIDDAYQTDKVILLYVLLPIIQQEITEWVFNHNANPIRPQRERTKHVPGIPDELYTGKDRSGRLIAQQYGFIFDEATWEDCSTKLGSYDSKEVLTEATQAWCRATLSQLGLTERPRANEFITRSNGKVVPYWYQCLVLTARHHDASELLPKLELAEKPY